MDKFFLITNVPDFMIEKQVMVELIDKFSL